ASTLGLSTVLAKLDENNREYIGVYTSRSINKPKKNYLVPELECLAVIWLKDKHARMYTHEQEDQQIVYMLDIGDDDLVKSEITV
ncbi:14141_t:CDS:2, partial [Dentiscutata heterogama]